MERTNSKCFAFLGKPGKLTVWKIRAEKLTLVNAIMLAAPIEDEKTVLGNIVNLLDGCGKMKDLLKKGVNRGPTILSPLLKSLPYLLVIRD